MQHIRRYRLNLVCIGHSSSNHAQNPNQVLHGRNWLRFNAFSADRCPNSTRTCQTCVYRSDLICITSRPIIYIIAIDQFISSCRKLIENGPEHIGLMEEAHEEAIKLSETIQSLGTGLYYEEQISCMSFNHLVDGLKTKKAVKVHENHAWNCRLLRGQIEQLKNAISESIRQLTQVVEGAIQYNLIQVSISRSYVTQFFRRLQY